MKRILLRAVIFFLALSMTSCVYQPIYQDTYSQTPKSSTSSLYDDDYYRRQDTE